MFNIDISTVKWKAIEMCAKTVQVSFMAQADLSDILMQNCSSRPTSPALGRTPWNCR